MVTRWWDEQALPRLVDLALRDRVSAPWRAPVCAAATGTVLEFGFGSGLNLVHYPAAVERVWAVEPSQTAWAMSASAREQFGRPVERVGADAAAINLPDASVDTVVSTWTLCTIPDLAGALAEARRLLRPGGAMQIVEHQIPDAQPGAAIARFVQPAWGRVAGGCHLDRDLEAAISHAGGTFTRRESRFLTGTIVWN